MKIKLLEQKKELMGALETGYQKSAVKTGISVTELHEFIANVHQAHLDDIQNFQGVHRMYLKSSERFD